MSRSSGTSASASRTSRRTGSCSSSRGATTFASFASSAPVWQPPLRRHRACTLLVMQIWRPNILPWRHAQRAHAMAAGPTALRSMGACVCAAAGVCVLGRRHWQPKPRRVGPRLQIEGRTGVAFVDANMRELAATGFMSNRGRHGGHRCAPAMRAARCAGQRCRPRMLWRRAALCARAVDRP